MKRSHTLAVITAGILVGWGISIAVVWWRWNPNAATLVAIVYLPVVALLTSIYTEIL